MSEHMSYVQVTFQWWRHFPHGTATKEHTEPELDGEGRWMVWHSLTIEIFGNVHRFFHRFSIGFPFCVPTFSIKFHRFSMIFKKKGSRFLMENRILNPIFHLENWMKSMKKDVPWLSQKWIRQKNTEYLNSLEFKDLHRRCGIEHGSSNNIGVLTHILHVWNISQIIMNLYIYIPFIEHMGYERWCVAIAV